ncbi:TEAD [Mytilus edulis]|uniref:TEAD n=1 Tax=Mytilus edulis TaxID=6550 RepID=A0A8S3SGK2_MYTED|nr:TEAD [Mytilus edulis]
MRKQSTDTDYSQKERENGEKARSVPVLETAVKRDILEIDKSLFFPKEAMREFVFKELDYYPYSLITNQETFPCSVCNVSQEMRLEREMLIKLPMEDNSFNGSLKEMYHQMIHLTISEIKKMFYHIETGILCSIQYLAKRIMEKDEYQFGMGEKVHETISDLLFDSIKSGGGKENDFRWMKLRSGKTTRRTRSQTMNNLQDLTRCYQHRDTKLEKGEQRKECISNPKTTPNPSTNSGGGKENDSRWMKLRSGKTTRRTRRRKMNNLQGFHPLSPAPGTKVGEGTIAKDIKSIPEEETEEAHPYISENLAQPEDQGAAAPMPKAKETEKGGAGVEFGSRTQSKYKLSLYLMFPMYHQT